MGGRAASGPTAIRLTGLARWALWHRGGAPLPARQPDGWQAGSGEPAGRAAIDHPPACSLEPVSHQAGYLDPRRLDPRRLDPCT